MQEYDIALKLLLQASTDSLMRQLTGVSVARWLNVETPQVSSSRVDLLGETPERALVHIELQSTNDPDMALRMAEYSLRVYRQFTRFPKQIVLYVGQRKMRMKAQLSGPDCAFGYTLVDLRELDGTSLLASERVEDSFLAILMRLEDRTLAIRQILERIAGLEQHARRDALSQFLILSQIRALHFDGHYGSQGVWVFNPAGAPGRAASGASQPAGKTLRTDSQPLEKRFAKLSVA